MFVRQHLLACHCISKCLAQLEPCPIPKMRTSQFWLYIFVDLAAPQARNRVHATLFLIQMKLHQNQYLGLSQFQVTQVVAPFSSQCLDRGVSHKPDTDYPSMFF